MGVTAYVAVAAYGAYQTDKRATQANKHAKDARAGERAWREQQLEYQKERDAAADQRYEQERQFRIDQDAKREEQARQEKLRRDGLLAQMMNDAQLTDDELGQALDTSQADVTQAFGARRQALQRDLAKNFVDPSSGKARALNAEMDISQAATTAGARNVTRNTLRARESQDIAHVRGSALNLSDPLGSVLGNPLSAGAFNQPVARGYGEAINGMAGYYGDQARYYGGVSGAYDRATGAYLNSLGRGMGYYAGYQSGQQSSPGQGTNAGFAPDYNNSGYGGHPTDYNQQEVY